MKTTEILMDEHKSILKVLDRVETLVEQPFQEVVVELKFIIEFIQKYSDEYHHKKEEEIYFEWIGKHSPSLKSGPVSCMLGEHDKLRGLTMNAKNALNHFTENDDLKAKDVAIDSLKMFSEILRSHIGKEDNMLYQMAERLDERVNCGDAEMMSEFDKVEKTFGEGILKFEEYCSSLE